MDISIIVAVSVVSIYFEERCTNICTVTVSDVELTAIRSIALMTC